MREVIVEGSGGFRVSALVAAVAVVSLIASPALAGSSPDVNEDTVGCYMPGVTAPVQPGEDVWAFSAANTAPAQGLGSWTTFGDPTAASTAVAGKFGGGNVTGISVYSELDAGGGEFDGFWQALDSVTGGPDPDTYYALPIESAYITGGSRPIPLAGNWAGNGNPGVGLYYPDTGVFVIDTNPGPGPDTTIAPFEFGPKAAGDIVPIAGDFNGDGNDTVGVYEKSTSIFYLTNMIANGAAQANATQNLVVFKFGDAANGMIPIAGDWDLMGGDSVGLYDVATSTMRLTYNNAATLPADIVAVLSGATATCQPVTGNWNVSQAN